MRDVGPLLLSWAVTTAAVFAIVLLDEHRLDPARRERAWPPASRAAALVCFGALALPVHFVRTRRSLSGAFVGLGAAAGVAALDAAAQAALEAALR